MKKAVSLLLILIIAVGAFLGTPTYAGGDTNIVFVSNETSNADNVTRTEYSETITAAVPLAAANTVGNNISLKLLSDGNAAVPSIELDSKGSPATIYIEETNSADFYGADAVIGMPVDISGGGSFETATLTFSFKEQQKAAVICKYSDEKVTAYTTTYSDDNMSAKATINSVGTYFVMDAQKVLDEFAFKYVDILVVSDHTGMTSDSEKSVNDAVVLLCEELKEKRIKANILEVYHNEIIEIYKETEEGFVNSYVYPSTVNIDVNEKINSGFINLTEGLPLFVYVVSDNSVNVINDELQVNTYSYDDFAAYTSDIAKQIHKEVVGEGIIYIKGPVPVKVQLNSELTQDGTGDTDGDGLKDIEELEGAVPSGKFNLSTLASIIGQDVSGEEYGEVSLYKYTSNPVLKDTDFDGINDDKDATPKNNEYAGTMHCTVDNKNYDCSITFNVDYRDLLEGYNTVYSKDLSVLSSLLASDIYKNLYIETTSGSVLGGNDNASVFASMMGLYDIELIKVSASEYSDDKDDVTDFMIGHREITYKGKTKDVIVLSVRGTNETNAEWSSNFDVGADTDEYYAATGKNHPHWLNKENHKGFDVTANRVYEKALKYISSYVGDADEKVILITGHSRGAAIANILGTFFEASDGFSSYTYTFATPNTTTDKNASSYKTIFNIKNADDLIPYLPIEAWGFTNYGTTMSISIEKNYESGFLANDVGTFEWLIGEDYNNDGGTQRTLDSFAAITTTREGLYVIDTSSDGTAYENGFGHFTLDAAQNELAELTATFESEKLMKFCTFNVVKGAIMYKVKINYSPAYLMQSLANMTTGVGPLLGHAISGVYADAKNSFIASSGKVVIGGLTHPHMQPTYYLLAYNNFLPLK